MTSVEVLKERLDATSAAIVEAADSGVSVVIVVIVVVGAAAVVINTVSADPLDAAAAVSDSSVDMVSCCDVHPFHGLTVEASVRTNAADVSDGRVRRAALPDCGGT